MPPLDARAARPSVVRLRRSVVIVAVMAASGVFAGALAWAFLVEPDLRGRGELRRLQANAAEARGGVRPSERVTSAPASYGQLDALPPPRVLAVPASGRPSPPSPSAAPPRHGPDEIDEARQSQLFFPDPPSAALRPLAAASPALSGPEAAAAGLALPAAGNPMSAPDYRATYNPHRLAAPLSPYELKAGAVLPAALLTAVETGRDGPVVAAVTENVFDTVSGAILLIPQGSRLIGRHAGDSQYGETRVYVAWDRLILPNGKSLVLTQEPGVDAQGAAGVEGRVDRRIGSLAIATLFAGAITTLGQVARDHQDQSVGLLSAGDAAAIEGAQVGGRLIDRELEVRPTIRLEPGARIRVLVTRDLVLERYAP